MLLPHVQPDLRKELVYWTNHGGMAQGQFFSRKKNNENFFCSWSNLFFGFGWTAQWWEGCPAGWSKKTTFSQIVLTTPFNERIILTLLRFDIVAQCGIFFCVFKFIFVIVFDCNLMFRATQCSLICCEDSHQELHIRWKFVIFCLRYISLQGRVKKRKMCDFLTLPFIMKWVFNQNLAKARLRTRTRSGLSSLSPTLTFTTWSPWPILPPQTPAPR